MSTPAAIVPFDRGRCERVGVGPTVEQLDLFAELEAAEMQRRLDCTPTLFDTEQRGYFVRVAATEQWARDYGHFDCLRRSHSWHAQISSRAEQPTDTCKPAILTAALYCDHPDGDCLCVGDAAYRGARLHCTWEGPVRDNENNAAEDAHDHAWPGWRELPLVPRHPETATGAEQTKAMSRWVEHVNAIYPSGWLESGGPIRTSRHSYGTRHVPDHTGYGGYDLCGQVVPPEGERS